MTEVETGALLGLPEEKVFCQTSMTGWRGGERELHGMLRMESKGGTLPLKESMLLFSRIMGIVGLKKDEAITLNNC